MAEPKPSILPDGSRHYRMIAEPGVFNFKSSSSKTSTSIEELENEVKRLTQFLKESEEKLKIYDIKLERYNNINNNIIIGVLFASALIIITTVATILVENSFSNKRDIDFYARIEKDRSDALLKIQKIELKQSGDIKNLRDDLINRFDLMKAKNPKLVF
mgnify:CR=1 FL=1